MYYSIFSSMLVSVFMSAGKSFSQATFKMIHTAAKSWDAVLCAGLVLSFCFLQYCLKYSGMGDTFLSIVHSPHTFSSITSALFLFFRVICFTDIRMVNKSCWQLSNETR